MHTKCSYAYHQRVSKGTFTFQFTETAVSSILMVMSDYLLVVFKKLIRKNRWISRFSDFVSK